MTEKKLPDTNAVYMVYDNRNRLVFTQDGNLRNSDTWLFNAYDDLNRLAVTGTYTNIFFTDPRDITNYDNYQNYQVSWSSSTHDYSLSSLFTGFNSIQTKTYYDNYDFLLQSAITGLSFNHASSCDSYDDVDATDNGYFDAVKGQVTGSATLVLDGAGSHWVYSASYYDDKSRVIQTQSTLYPSGTRMSCGRYDFTGNILETYESQTVNGATNSIRLNHNLDHAGRITDTYIYLNGADPVLLSSAKYFETGELKEKNLHSTDFSSYLQSVDFDYNIRGWLTEINDPDDLTDDDDLFAMKLHYDDLDQAIGTNGLYNGNISAVSWTRDNLDTIRAYAFRYDDISRIKSANFKYKTGSTWSDPSQYGTYYWYDDNGNITNLSRRDDSGTVIDSIEYDYTGTGNMLKSIKDDGTSAGVHDRNTSGDDFVYDDNGNMTWDKNKNIKLDYNYLNLPEKIFEETGTGDELSYVYDAAGVKWMKKLDDDITITKTMYAGAFVYRDVDNDTVHDFGLDYILTPEGMASKDGSSFDYEYHLKDHLGNTRLVFDENGSEVQSADYYPFGMTFQISNTGTDNQYLYNGKELQDEQLGGINLDWYDYGARFYDPALGRFHTQDKFAEKYLSLSPYQYAANNPILFIDVNGDSLWITHNTGFLGLGSKQNLLYENGNLSNEDGSAYAGKVKGFLSKSVNALNTISSTQEGVNMVGELQSSSNNFTIVKGGSKFTASSPSKAFANQIQTDPAQAVSQQAFQNAGINLAGGSGGTISWNPSGATIPTLNGSGVNGITDLGHEMFHGLDANRGLLDTRVHQGIKRSEWQAVYRENMLRSQLGSRLRTHYIKSVDANGAFIGGQGTRMLTPANQPLRPNWYKP